MYKILECYKCEGKGYIIIKHLPLIVLDSVREIYERKKCKKCKGTGIIKEEIKE